MTRWTFDVNTGLRLSIKSVLSYGLVIAILSTFVLSSPEATFPFNAQVPSVATVGESYKFTLSATTFSSKERIIRYSLEKNPTWLRIDSNSRTLSGIPREEDVGPFDFDILATDATGMSLMHARLVVLAKPMQNFGSEFEGQLKHHGSLNGPNSILLSPSQQFELNFDPKADQGARARLSYYATMSNHSPLPPWIIFDNSALKVHGVAPSFESYPREYKLLLIASDVPGFAGITFDFSLVVSNHDFRFIPQQRSLMISPGESFEFAGLQDALYMDGELAKIDKLRSMKAFLPPNLYFETRNFVVKGVAASESQTFSIVVEDHYGNTAETTMTISPKSERSLGRETITAFRGSTFEYEIPKALISQHQHVQVHFGEAASWLNLGENTQSIHGYIPSNLESSLVKITIEVSFADAKMSEIHELLLQIESKSSTMSFPTPQSSVSLPSPPSARENIASKIKGKEKRQPKKSVIAIAVTVSIVMSIVMFALCLALFKRYRVRSKFKKNLNTRNISLPMSQRGAHQHKFDNSYNCNYEDSPGNGDHVDRWYGNPPQLSPIIPRRLSRRPSWQEAIIGTNEEAKITNFKSNPAEAYIRPSERRYFMNKKQGQATDFEGKEKCSSCNLNEATPYTSQPIIVYPGDRHPPIYGDSEQARHCHQCNKVTKGVQRQISSNSLLSRSLSLASFTPSIFPAPPLLPKACYRRSTPIPPKQNSIRLVPRTPSVLTLTDGRTISEKRQSYIRARVSGPSPFFSASSYKKSTRTAEDQDGKVQPSCNRLRSSISQHDQSFEGTSDSIITKSPSLATAEREIEEFWINYSSAKETAGRQLPLNRLNRQGFIKDSLEKLEASSQYTLTSGTTSQVNASSHSSPAKTQDDKEAECTRPISTKLVDRPHPLVGRRNNTQRRRSRMKSFFYLPTSKLPKQSSNARPISSYFGEENYLDLNAKKGLGIVLDLNPYKGSEISIDDCDHTIKSRSPLSEISNSSPKPRLVDGKGKRPVSVQGIKHEDRWGSLNGLRGNEAFI